MSDTPTAGDSQTLIPAGTPAGECPNCGLVVGGMLDYRFPNPSECNDCGAELTRTTVPSEDVEVPA